MGHGRAAPDEAVAVGARPSVPGAVVLLHGIARTRRSLRRMARGLAAVGFEVHNLAGPSGRLPLEAQAARLRRDLEALGREVRAGRPDGAGAPAVLHGVGHSMGGVVLRAALARAEGAALADLGWQSPALRRLARAAAAGGGPEVGVVVGRRGFQPLAPAFWINVRLGVGGDTDGTIEPASARGDGLWPPPADVLEVDAGHTLITADAEVVRQAAHFLMHGRFDRP